MDKIESIKKNYYDILPAYNIDSTLIYTSKKYFRLGSLVKVSIRNKIVAGCIISIYETKPKKNFKVKDIEEYDNHFYLNTKNIEFLKWVSKYNFISLGLTLKLLIQDISFIKPEKHYKYLINKKFNSKLTSKQINFLQIIKKNKINQNEAKDFSKSFITNLINKGIIKKKNIKKKYTTNINYQNIHLKKLSLHQNIIFQKILEKIKIKTFKPIYLDGVTGSGKTEVYFKLIEYFLIKKKQVLVLIPEIALCNQWVSRFYDAFKFYPLVWNSKINKGQKRKIWQAIIEGQVNVVVGARSAIFLPFKNLGAIVIDEENDISYKQEENPIYNARDMAVVKSKINFSNIILVSATPSIETYHNYKNRKYDYYKLKNRFGTAKDPKVFLIDMKLDKNKVISEQTFNILKEKLDKGKQVLLLINRRGYAPITICAKCGFKETCKNCDINFVYHKNKNKLICHHCGAYQTPNNICSNCNATDKKISLGYGIEKVTEEINKKFNNVNTISLSSDSINDKKFVDVLKDIENAKIKIIIGTQIISKGFNFLNLSSIFILDFDLWFYNTDIRTNEKIFQLTHQVSGRTSRKSETGEVFIQTYDTNNYLLKYIIANNRNQFYEDELSNREKILLPPYCKLIAIILSGADKGFLEIASNVIKKKLQTFNDLKILGPVPAPIEYINNKHRFRMLIKTNQPFHLQNILKSIDLKKISKNKIKIKIDIDPLSFF